MVEREPESGLREVVHQRVRLGVLAVLDRQGPCTFAQLRDALGQSDGGLSRHLGVLEEHGLIVTEKVFENRRPRTWVRLAAAGTEAFREERELLAKLLDRATGAEGDDERTTAMAIVFASLLAGDDEEGTGDETAATDRSTLAPVAPTLAGHRVREIASGAVSARYEFPAAYGDFDEQREQRLMMITHGLRGGWITSWRDDDPRDRGLTAHALVVELGATHDGEAILAAMGPSTVDLSRVPGARAYRLPGPDDGSPTTAVAWVGVDRFLASISVVAPGDLAVAALRDLAAEVHESLSHDRT